MCQEALRTIFRSVTIAKLLYASSAWGGFTKATDQQRVKAFLHRCVRWGYWSPDIPTFAEQYAIADEKCFEKIYLNNNHIAYHHLLLLSHRATDTLRPQGNYRSILAIIWLTPVLSLECFLLTFTNLFLNSNLTTNNTSLSLCLSAVSVFLSINKYEWMNEWTLFHHQQW